MKSRRVVVLVGRGLPQGVVVEREPPALTFFSRALVRTAAACLCWVIERVFIVLRVGLSVTSFRVPSTDLLFGLHGALFGLASSSLLLLLLPRFGR